MRPPTVCKHSVSGTISLPLSGCFSPFPHGTCSLSVTEEYLGLEGGPPMFRQDYTCPALLEDHHEFLPVRGYHPLWRVFHIRFRFFHNNHWPGPRSLATTSGVSVDVLSSRYLDVSVPWVCFCTLCIQAQIPSNDILKSGPELLRIRITICRRWVSPFGDLGINGCSHLPQAYRSVPRPSSPLTAKASTRCP